MRTIITTIGIIALLFVAGCSNPIPQYKADTLTSMLEPKPGMAKLVIYYPYSYVWSDRIADVKETGVQNCRLKSGNFILRDISPGKQTINVSLCNGNEISTFTLVARAGQKYYLQVLPNDKSLAGIAARYNSNVRMATGDAHVEGPAFYLDLTDESYAVSRLLWEKQVAAQ